MPSHCDWQKKPAFLYAGFFMACVFKGVARVEICLSQKQQTPLLRAGFVGACSSYHCELRAVSLLWL